jgi:hypothetical protein
VLHGASAIADLKLFTSSLIEPTRRPFRAVFAGLPAISGASPCGYRALAMAAIFKPAHQC